MADKPTKQVKTDETSTAVIVQRKQDLSTLPPAVQAALARYETREMAGVVPQWKPEKEGDFLIGTVLAVRHDVGQYHGTVLTLSTPDGPKAVFLSADMKIKLGEDNLVDRNFVIQFEGMLKKTDNPKLKNDMKVYKVIEVMGPNRG